MAYLGDKSIGDIVKIKENGVLTNYIIVHKGKPSSLYDSSCDGVWVLREKLHSAMKWSEDSGNYNNNYENSSINAWLNGTFLNTIDEKIRAAIKTVKIPFKKGTGNASTGVQSSSNGLSCKAFLLAGNELNHTSSTGEDLPIDGAKLSFFSNGGSIIGNNGNGAVSNWWLRSPRLTDATSAYMVSTYNTVYPTSTDNNNYARPAFVLPTNLLVGSDGTVTTNSPPTITSDKTGNLGTLADGFTCNYSVNDTDSTDALTVTLSVDSTAVKTFTATKGAQYTYSLTGTDWLKISNGSHTFTISVTDGKETVTSTASFTRACNKLITTLSTPLAADDRIRACSLKIEGSIPESAVCTYEVTNNANDSAPVWEDCTENVKDEKSHVFTNKTAENGFAFNFRVTIQRGSTNSGGYITKISGGFE